MHEVLLSRGDVTGCDELIKIRIHTRVNCVALHPECHTHAEGSAERAKCARMLLLYEGFDKIIYWLNDMQSIMRSQQPTEQIVYLRSLIDNLSRQDIPGFESKSVWRF